MLRIKKATYFSEYKIKILFSDGKTKIVDFENWINEGGYYFLPLKNLDFFKKVEIDESNYSICWPNGADVSPDTLYEIGKEAPKKITRKSSRVNRRKIVNKKQNPLSPV